MSDPGSEPATHSLHQFATTHWSAVLLAGEAASAETQQALEDLCRAYWYPLYAYVRRQGHSPDDAQDLTQEFFARLLEHKYVRLADRQRGRFRTFLLSSLKNFLINEWEKSRTAKRGGADATFSLDEQDAEGRYLAEPVDGLTPERIYEKRWAVTLLEKVLARLRDKYMADGKAPLFDALKPYVWGETLTDGYDEIGARLGMSAGALRIAMHRLRESYRELLRDEVARTVASPAEIDEELRQLVAALRS
ncbi:MAG TPA: RNA polymerase sigma factor [Methylomirabilota bacterium]|nr:RNA polymerase sigma factor [Methylomirabilota bacterium]